MEGVAGVVVQWICCEDQGACIILLAGFVIPGRMPAMVDAWYSFLDWLRFFRCKDTVAMTEAETSSPAAPHKELRAAVDAHAIETAEIERHRSGDHCVVAFVC